MRGWGVAGQITPPFDGALCFGSSLVSSDDIIDELQITLEIEVESFTWV